MSARPIITGFLSRFDRSGRAVFPLWLRVCSADEGGFYALPGPTCNWPGGQR